MELDPETLTDVVTRLRRIQGQVGGIVQMIDDGRDCKDIVVQFAAVSRALDRAGFRLIATGLAQCAHSETAEADRAELERLFLALA